jgi:hypothetical protein
MAFLLTFCGVFPELPLSQLLRVGLRFDPDGGHVFAPPEPGPGGLGRPRRPARAGGGQAGHPGPGRRGRRWTKGYLTVTHCSPFIPSSAA